MKSLVSLGLKPDIVTYNSLLQSYVKSNRLREAETIFEKMIVANIPPGAITYNTLISGYAKIGNDEM